MELKRVVVTGLGTINPIGNNIAEYWESLKNGVSGSDMIQQFDASKFKTSLLARLKTSTLKHISIAKKFVNSIFMRSML